jgi:hypothetical protein
MKRFAPFALFFLLCTLSFSVFSQNNIAPSPSLFYKYPNSIACSETELAKIFSFEKGKDVSINFENKLLFTGKVISNVSKYSNLQSVVIKSALFNNAIFHVSKITQVNNSITYVGRIIQQEYSDGFQIQINQQGNYELHKIETKKIIPDCATH